jgi:hypothetical protein
MMMSIIIAVLLQYISYILYCLYITLYYMTGSRIYMSGQRKGIGQLTTDVQLFHEKSKI